MFLTGSMADEGMMKMTTTMTKKKTVDAWGDAGGEIQQQTIKEDQKKTKNTSFRYLCAKKKPHKQLFFYSAHYSF